MKPNCGNCGKSIDVKVTIPKQDATCRDACLMLIVTVLFWIWMWLPPDWKIERWIRMMSE